ncbi:hypothetical protein EVAR_26089_1 [Eumeta japonica]|uniref:Uncharacterized protein n=1 Tax=Eumeta variegata TaxID=151549 RepID=A0A4C1WXC9_EUMVA|nr:hypothetical protein EVAR_26089_1 [Eumeta japonica]
MIRGGGEATAAPIAETDAEAFVTRASACDETNVSASGRAIGGRRAQIETLSSPVVSEPSSKLRSEGLIDLRPPARRSIRAACSDARNMPAQASVAH